MTILESESHVDVEPATQERTAANREDRLELGKRLTGQILELEDGFTVAALWRLPVHVSCEDGLYYEVRGGSDYRQKFGLAQTEQLRDAVVRLLRQPQKGIGNVARVRRAISDPLQRQFDRLLEAVDPNVIGVQRAMSSVSTAPPELAMCRHLYGYPYLVRDIIAHPAAAIVAANYRRLVPHLRQNRIKMSSHFAALQSLAASQGARLYVHVHSGLRETELGCHACCAQVLPHLLEWRNLLSPTGYSYRSLNRTVARLPRDVPGALVCELSCTTLSRPVTDRLELLLVTVLSRDAQRLDEAQAQVFLKARGPQIREALRRVARSTRNDLQETDPNDVCFLVRFLLDVPGTHPGTIVGLADKAIKWHQRQRAEQRAKVLAQYGARTQVSPPPIPVLSDPAVRHLKTVEEIAREGELMEHCAASYVPRLLDGTYYLFHVERDGEGATVMVHKSGKVVEARGRRNRRNHASRWGEKALAKWGRRLQSEKTQRAG